MPSSAEVGSYVLIENVLSCTLTGLIFGALKRITTTPINTFSKLYLFIFYKLDNVVNVTTRYGLKALEIEFRWGRALPHASRPVLRPTQPLVNLVQVLC